MIDSEPTPNVWYRDVVNERTFMVTSVDERRDAVEVQHFDGDIEEIELSEWLDLDLEVTEPPEDWSGPVDAEVSEDLDDGESAARSTGRKPMVDGESI
jgi:hypothetical protein